MLIWAHLSDVPQPIRDTISNAFVPFDKRDLAVESAINAMVDHPVATTHACRALQGALNPVRVPALCQAVHDTHGLSWRASFRAVGLFLGLSETHVRDLFYRRPQ